MYNLHTIRNLEILLAFPLNVCGFVTLTFDPVLGQCYSTRVWTDFRLGLGLGQ